MPGAGNRQLTEVKAEDSSALAVCGEQQGIQEMIGLLYVVGLDALTCLPGPNVLPHSSW